MKPKSATLNNNYVKVVSIKHLMVLGCMVIMTGIAWAQCPAMNWIQVYGGSADEAFHAVEIIDGYGYIGAGYTMSSGSGGKDAYLVMTDLNGNTRWEKTYGGTRDDVANAVVVADNCYILAGYTESMGHGGKDIYLVCVDKEGSMVWKKTYGSIVDEEALAIVQDQDGGYLITGYTGSYDRNVVLLKIDEYGNKLWYNDYLLVGDDIGYDVIDIANDGYLIAGSSDILCGDQADGIIIRTDNTGTISWIKRFGEKGIDVFRSACLSSDNGYVLAGYTDSDNEDYDVYVVSLNENGDLLWAKKYGSDTDEYGYAIQVRSSEGYIVCGYKDDHDKDCYLISTDDNGVVDWETEFRYAGDNIGFALENTGSDKYLIAGYTEAQAGGSDAFLLMLSSDVGDDLTSCTNTEPSVLFTPNPAKVRTQISLALKKRSNVSIEVFNILGQEVKRLSKGTLDKGTHTAVWNLQDNNGHKVASGVYFVKTVVDGQESTERLVVMH